MNILNRKAKYEYALLKDYTAGMVLMGSEVKSLREGKANITDAFVVIRGGEVFIRNMFIDKYKESSYLNHEEKRDRKLLLNRKEIKALERELLGTGKTIVPLSVFLVKNLIKIRISLAVGKKTYDKKMATKERDIKRETQRDQNTKY